MCEGSLVSLQSPPRVDGADRHLPTSGITATLAPKCGFSPAWDACGGASIRRVSPLPGLRKTTAPFPPFASGTPTSTRFGLPGNGALTITDPKCALSGAVSDPLCGGGRPTPPARVGP